MVDHSVDAPVDGPEVDTQAKPGTVNIAYLAYCEQDQGPERESVNGPPIGAERFDSQGSANSWATQHVTANPDHIVHLTMWCYTAS